MRQLFLLLGVSIALAGCSQSAEDKAVARLATFKKPGHVRLVNLTTETGKIQIDGRDGNPVQGGGFSLFEPVGVKTHEVAASISGKELLREKVDVETEKAYTVYTYSEDGSVKATLVSTESRGASGAEPVVQLIYVGSKGSKLQVTRNGSPVIGATAPGSVSEASTVSEGSSTLSVTDEAGKEVGNVTINTEKGDAFGIVCQSVNGKTTVQVLKNSPARKPAGSGGLSAS